VSDQDQAVCNIPGRLIDQERLSKFTSGFIVNISHRLTVYDAFSVYNKLQSQRRKTRASVVCIKIVFQVVILAAILFQICFIKKLVPKAMINSEPSTRRLVLFTETILHYMSTLWDQIIYMYKAEAWRVDRSIRNVYKI